MLLPLGLLNCTLCEAGNPPIPGTLRSQAQGPKGRSLGVSFFFKQAFFLMCTICQAFIVRNVFIFVFYTFLSLCLLEKEMATHSSTLAWKILWTGEPGRRQSMGSQRARRD